MGIKIRQYSETDTKVAVRIWNHTAEEEATFPQIELLAAETGKQFFSKQSFIDIAYGGTGGDIVGLCILHPNSMRRCGHIYNASYVIKSEPRGCRIGEALVRHCMEQGKELGLKILQLNAMMRSNVSTLHMYEKLGFTQLDVIPGGFLIKDGSCEDIIPHYHVL